MILPPTFTEEKNTIHAIIETPRGSTNKYDYNQQNDFFQLKKVLPSGTSFPFDFGFIPYTLAPDGDPLDVLVIMDFSSFSGCVIQCRVIGVIEAQQREKNQKPIRNDRIVAVASESLTHSNLKEISALNKNLLQQIIHLFKYYNKMEGKEFKLLKIKNANAAIKSIRRHIIDKK